MSIVIRPYHSNDFQFIRDMFYESLFVPEGQQPFDRNILDNPELRKYLENFGQPADYGFVAIEDDRCIGAIWSRFFSPEDPGYGFVNAEFPEFGIAILSKYRNQGVGGRLIQKLIGHLKSKSINGVSLSVDARNPALRLYQRMGFTEFQKDGDSITMVKRWS